LDAHPDLAAVAGRRRERSPQASIYNQLIDLEWETPVGDAEALGGDAVFRISTFESVGGFDPTVRAGEEPELCHRLRRAGWTVRRLDAEMTRHDAAIHSFGQWWRRQVRTGYGARDVATRFGLDFFRRITRSAVLWAVGMPIVGIVGVAIAAGLWGWPGAWVGIAVTILILVLQVIRLTGHGIRQGLATRKAVAFAVFTLVSKLGQAYGQWHCWRDRRGQREVRLIEYKKPAHGGHAS
jgi:hypothetical protein